MSRRRRRRDRRRDRPPAGRSTSPDAERVRRLAASSPSPGCVVGEKITPIASAGLFMPSGKASYPSVAYQLGGAGGRRRRAADRARRATDPRRRRRRRPGRARRVPQARHRATSSASTARPASPPSASAPSRSRRCARSSGPARPPVTLRPGRDAAPRRRHDDAARADREPRDRRRQRRPDAPRRRPADRGRARHRLVGRARHDVAPTLAAATDVELARQLADLPAGAGRRRPGRRSARTAGACSSTISTTRSTSPTATPPSTSRSPSPTTPSTASSTGSSTPARSCRSAHAVQRGQLRDRLPGVAARRAGSPTSRRASPSRRSSSAPPSPAPTTARCARMAPSIIALADHEGFPAHAAAIRLRQRLTRAAQLGGEVAEAALTLRRLAAALQEVGHRRLRAGIAERAREGVGLGEQLLDDVGLGAHDAGLRCRHGVRRERGDPRREAVDERSPARRWAAPGSPSPTARPSRRRCRRTRGSPRGPGCARSAGAGAPCPCRRG